MAAAATERIQPQSSYFQCGDVDTKTTGARGRNRRVMAEANRVKIRQLTDLVEDLVAHMTAADHRGSPPDSLADRILCVIPRLESAMNGKGGRLSNRAERLRGNVASHAPKQVGAASAHYLVVVARRACERGGWTIWY